MENNGSEALVQNRVWKKNNRLTFLDNRTLRIDTQHNNRTTSYRIDVIALKEQPQRSLVIAWPWLIAAVVLTGLLLEEIQWQFLFPVESWVSLAAKVAIGILSIACLALFIKFTYSKHLFKTRHAKVPLVEIWAGTPSRKAVNNFIKLMEHRIEKAHSHMNLSNDQQLTGEMKMLRRLVEEGILQQSKYDAARDRLMKKF